MVLLWILACIAACTLGVLLAVTLIWALIVGVNRMWNRRADFSGDRTNG